MTQVLKARSGIITEEMEAVAADENLDVEFIRQGIAEGRIVIPRNKNGRNLNTVGLGKV